MWGIVKYDTTGVSRLTGDDLTAANGYGGVGTVGRRVDYIGIIGHTGNDYDIGVEESNMTGLMKLPVHVNTEERPKQRGWFGEGYCEQL